MTTQEIENEVLNDKIKYGNSLYTNPVPKDLIELFKKSLLAVPIGNMIVKKVRLSLVKKTTELNVTEVGVMVNHILLMPPEKLNSDLNKALDKVEQLQQVVFDYNMDNMKKEKEFNERRETLYALSGANNGNVKRLIAQA